jgi:hypothetical protein
MVGGCSTVMVSVLSPQVLKLRTEPFFRTKSTLPVCSG